VIIDVNSMERLKSKIIKFINLDC